MTLPSLHLSLSTVVPLMAAAPFCAAFAPFGARVAGVRNTESMRVNTPLVLSSHNQEEMNAFPLFDGDEGSSSSSNNNNNNNMNGNSNQHRQQQQQQQEEDQSTQEFNAFLQSMAQSGGDVANGAHTLHNMDGDVSTHLSSADYFALEAFQLGNVHASLERYERLHQETETKKRFVFGNELLELRQKVSKLRAKLPKVQRRSASTEEVDSLRARIRRLSLRDAEFVYGEMLDLAEQAKVMGHKQDAEDYLEEAAIVRGCLPHFNIEGLWVGKYGDHGYEMINVTYVGDTLIATKVTGDKNVPKDEITFTADLSPSFHRGSEAALAPIELSTTASKQWGTKGLMRFPGKGQVAAEGFLNAKYMEGQLIMVGEEYFSFAWVPIGYQIFFGRPSAELTLKMLKQSEEKAVVRGRQAFHKGDVQTMREYAAKCLEKTDLSWLDEEFDENGNVAVGVFDDELHFQ